MIFYLAVFLGFLLNFLIELIVVYVFLRKNPRKVILFVFLINIFTWPFANLFFGVYQNFYLIEASVIFIESFLIMFLFNVKYIKSLYISFLANSISALLSFIFGIANFI